MRLRLDPAFKEILGDFELDEIDLHPDTVYGIWADGTLAYFNPAWLRFAAENDGEPAISRDWGLGRRVSEAIPPELRSFYQEFFESSFDESGESTRPASFEYECSSAGIYRRFAMIVYGLRNRRGYLVVNSLVVERPHDQNERRPCPPQSDAYVDTTGVVHQCAHCRRVQHLHIKDRWDWVPAWVEKIPAGSSHTLCRFCFNYYYGRRK
jgi:hypothetical protein